MNRKFSHKKIRAYEQKLAAKMAEIKQRKQQESEQRHLEMHQELLARFETDMQSLNATQAEADEIRADLESIYQQGLQNIREDYQQDNRMLKVNDDITINIDEMIKRQAIIELKEEGVEPPTMSDLFIISPTADIYLHIGAVVVGFYLFAQILSYVFKWLNL